jgi:hypothetical protein
LKKKILNIGLFVLFVFILDRSASFLLEYLYKKNKDINIISHYFNMTAPEILILGNSQVQQNIDPGFFKKRTYSLGFAASELGLQESLLDMIIKRGKKPEVLLLNVDPSFFLKSVKYNGTDVKFIKYYYNKEESVRSHINAISPFERFKYFFDVYRFNGIFFYTLKRGLTGESVPYFKNGYLPLEAHVSDSLRLSGLDRVIPPGEEFDPLKLVYLDHIIEQCKRNNIRLICYTSSLFGKYRLSNLTVSNQLANYLSLKETPYINYVSNNIRELDRPVYWNDLLHMNKMGTDIQSKDLQEKLEIILNKSQK